MRFRTSVTTLIMASMAWLAMKLVTANDWLLEQPFDVFGVDVPVAAVLMGALLAGFLVFMVWLAVGGMSAAVTRAWHRFKNRFSIRVEKQYTRGMEALLNGHHEDARKYFAEVVSLREDHAMGRLKLGDVLALLQRHAEAVEHHARAHGLLPESTEALRALAEDYWELKDLPRCKESLLELLQRDKGTAYRTLRRLREIYMLEENFPRALDVSERILKLRLEDSVRAREQRFNMGLLYLQASQMLDQGERRKAIGILRDVLKRDPQFTPAYLALGEALLEEQDADAAVHAWEDGYRATGHPVLLQELEEYWLGRNDPEGALRSLRRMAAAARHPAVPRFMLGRLYYRLEGHDEALKEFRLAQPHVDFSPTLHYFLGKVHERRKDFRQATEEFRKVIRESRVLDTQFHCSDCNAVSPQWLDYCPRCKNWNTYNLDLREIRSAEDLGLAPAYTAME